MKIVIYLAFNNNKEHITFSYTYYLQDIAHIFQLNSLS